MDGFTSVTFTPPRSPPHSYKFNSTTALACDDSVSQKLFMSCIFLSPLMMLITLFGLSTFWEPNEDLCLLMARVSVLLVAVGRTRLDNVHKKPMSSLTRFLPPSPGLAHVRWTEMMFFELAKGWDQYFHTQDTSLVQGICVPKSNTFTFWYFWPKN